MGTRTSHAPGTFSWVDLQTSDIPAAQAFYSALFGWEYDDMPLDDQGNIYSMAKVPGDEGHILALGGLNGGIPPHWNNYVTVESADAIVARVAELGGTPMGDAFDIFTAGRMAVFQDPTGAMLCVWEPRDNRGAVRVNDPGCLTWNELNTTDPVAAAAFYGDLFGWTFEELDMGGMGVYRTIRNGDRANGGIRDLPDEAKAMNAPPNWLPYFTVADAAASTQTARSGGGQVLVEPVTIPNGATIAVLADPQGAAFALFEGETED